MCGIIGYIGKNVEENLIDGLEKLEYRGYDSAGICVKREQNFYIEKALGSVEKLKKQTKYSSCEGVGVAHTRWATHGKITIENTHPHFSQDQNVCLVHNGIIENFESVKKELEDEGKTFYGETDSEVACKLLSGKLSLKKIKNMLEKIEGSYAFAFISKKNNCIFFAKNKSPLYVAIGQRCALIASDPSCFIGKAKEFYPINDGEYGKLSLKNIVFCDKNGKTVLKKSQKLNIEYKNENKNQYKHFMLKEINESEKVVESIIKNYQTEKILEKLEKIRQMNFNRVYLVGCGTAYHAGLIGERYFFENLKKDVYAQKASEFAYKNYILDKNSLCIFISQSGETIDTISALNYAKEKGARIVTITNVEYSTIASLSEYNLPICAGQEKAVASTKAYLGQCLVLYILSQYLSGRDFVLGLEEFKTNIDYGDDKKIKLLAKRLAASDKVFFIGRGYDYITSLEASLKLKEISYIFTCVEPSGELKHGPLALVEEGTNIIVVATEENLFSKTLNNAYETLSRGAKLILVTSFDIDQKIKNNFEEIFMVRLTCKKLMPIQTMIFFQKLAYFASTFKKINPDKPRNLAKSVTVE